MTASNTFTVILAPLTMFAPRTLFALIARQPLTPRSVFTRYALWIGLVPPVCAWFGMTFFGWRLGIDEPLYFSRGQAFTICAAYYLFLLLGFWLAARILLWMRPTYAVTAEPGACYALVATVGTPMMFGGLFHLYPLVALNILVLVPVLIWSIYLLYAGATPVLRTDAEHGMLMASSMLGFLLVALATFLGIIVLFWGIGFGPKLGV